MNYIGSKLSLLSFIEEAITEICGTEKGVFCDLFAGTGAVGTHFKTKGFEIIANDIQFYSYVLNRHYIANHKNLPFQRLSTRIPALTQVKFEERAAFVCDYLSNLKGLKGFVYRNYCQGEKRINDQGRLYFSDENGMLCDSIRVTIEEWKSENVISEDEYFFLLASLLESIDKRANTASVYGAFLKKLKKSAQVRMNVQPAKLFVNEKSHQVFNQDANQLIRCIETDILYLDPPYNHRQYATNYHLLETIAKNDNPSIYGKTGLRDYKNQKSKYCSRLEVKDAFRELILNARARFIFLSYNNEGLMSFSDIKEIMNLKGEYGFFSRKYPRFKADRDNNRKFSNVETKEYLHYVICE